MNSAARHSRMQSTNSLDDDGNDHFEDMPESESNMKKVKVLIGRGQELQEDDSAPQSGGLPPGALQAAQAAAEPVLSPVPAYHQAASSQTTAAQPVGAPQAAPPVAPPAENQPPAHNYLVAAAVIEDEAPHVRPYADDILKLVVTLPVEGQTQNVQFDFHLVRDDPVQVAKEMVQELGIPQGVVLEISETISALACSARMKQDSHNLKMQENPTQPPMQQAPVITRAGSDQGGSETHGVQAAGHNHPAQSSIGQGQVHTHGQPVHDPQSTVGQVPLHGIQPQQQQQHQFHTHVQPVHDPQTAVGQAPLHGMQQQQPQHQVHPHAQPVHDPHLTVGQAPLHGMQQQHYVAPSHPPPPPPVQQVPAAQVADPVPTAQFEIHQHGHAQPPAHVSSPSPVSATMSPSSPRPGMQSAIGPNAVGGMAVPFAGNQGGERAAPAVAAQPQRDVSPIQSEQLGLSEEDNEAMQAELRKLEEEYARNLERAKKVFDSRMVNLQRSQKEKEKEHLKTLEKHEKERAEFEKRRALEEEQQQRRLEQIQKERDRKIQSLAQEKRKTVMQNPGDMTAEEYTAIAETAGRDVENLQGSNLVQSERSASSWNQANVSAPAVQGSNLAQQDRTTLSWNQANVSAPAMQGSNLAQQEMSTHSWNQATAPSLQGSNLAQQEMSTHSWNQATAPQMAQPDMSTHNWNQTTAPAPSIQGSNIAQPEMSTHSWNQATASSLQGSNLAQSERSTHSWNQGNAPSVPHPVVPEEQKQPPSMQNGIV